MGEWADYWYGDNDGAQAIRGALMERMGCVQGPIQQEREDTTEWAMCSSSAHTHAYFGHYCEFANDLGVQVAAVLAPVVARLAAVPRDGELAALAHEAISAIGGSHNHWREGGAGGTCRACESANERQDELRARLRALLDRAGTGPGGGTT